MVSVAPSSSVIVSAAGKSIIMEWLSLEVTGVLGEANGALYQWSWYGLKGVKGEIIVLVSGVCRSERSGKIIVVGTVSLELPYSRGKRVGV